MDGRHRASRSASGATLAAPLVPTLLFRLVTPRRMREHVLGDLEEEYGNECRRTSEPAARRWYWKQLVRSFAPLAGYRARRSAAAGSLTSAAIGFGGILAVTWIWNRPAVLNLLGSVSGWALSPIFTLAELSTFVAGGTVVACASPTRPRTTAILLVAIVLSVPVVRAILSPASVGAALDPWRLAFVSAGVYLGMMLARGLRAPHA